MKLVNAHKKTRQTTSEILKKNEHSIFVLITVTFSDAITHCRGQRNSLHGNSQRNFTALFNNTWTLKSNKGRPTNAFFAVRRILLAYDYWRAPLRCLNCAQRFDYRELGSRRKLGGGTHI